MKSRSQLRAEAIERNAKYRDLYMKEAVEKYPDDKLKQTAYADHKQGIPKERKGYSYD